MEELKNFNEVEEWLESRDNYGNIKDSYNDED